MGNDHVTGQKPLATNLIEQLQGDLTLGLFDVVGLRDTGFFEPLWGTRPGLGQKQPQRRGEMTVGTDVVDRDGDLAVGLLAQLATVLVLDADGVLALLGEPGIVDDKDALGIGEVLSHHGAVAVEDSLFVPRALVDELLHGLLGV